MEINLYLGKNLHKFIVSKFMNHFIIPLDKVSSVLGSENDFEVLRIDRQGKLFNFVVETDEKELSRIVPVKHSGIFFYAKKTQSLGFSPFIMDVPGEELVKGTLTIICKHCNKEGFSGYYLNSFWGYPVEPEPFVRTLSEDLLQKSLSFWKDNAYRTDEIQIDVSNILIPYELFCLNTLGHLEQVYDCKFTTIGQGCLNYNHTHIQLDPQGDYIVLKKS